MRPTLDGFDTLTVELGARSYEIVIGDGAIQKAGELLSGLLKAPRAVIVTDENVAEHWRSELESALAASGISTRTLVLPPGEHTKSMTHLDRVMSDLLENNIDRKTTLIALGGGVIGDLTGFAAAIALRGVDFVQVPTTLLSQVDSSVGGKTGIDTPYGKNLIGAFHQPRAVITDTRTLDTLPMRERRCGYAEVLKYAVINDRTFFDWLCENGNKVLSRDDTARRYAVLRSCQSKAEVVAADEHEVGLRALLNLGHTFGHALEAQIGFDEKLKHGEAVAIGMVMAMDLSVNMDLAPASDRDALIAHLQDVGLQTDLKGLAGPNWTASALLDHMGRDKKTEGGKLTFILARGIGKSFIAPDVDPETVRVVLDDYISRAI